MDIRIGNPVGYVPDRRESDTIYRPHDIGYVRTERRSLGTHLGDGVDHFLPNTRQQWICLLNHTEFGTEGEL